MATAPSPPTAALSCPSSPRGLYFRPRTPTQFHNEGIRPPLQRGQSGAHCPVPIFFVLVVHRPPRPASDSSSAVSKADQFVSVPSSSRRLGWRYMYRRCSGRRACCTTSARAFRKPRRIRAAEWREGTATDRARAVRPVHQARDPLYRSAYLRTWIQRAHLRGVPGP